MPTLRAAEVEVGMRVRCANKQVRSATCYMKGIGTLALAKIF